MKCCPSCVTNFRLIDWRVHQLSCCSLEEPNSEPQVELDQSCPHLGSW